MLEPKTFGGSCPTSQKSHNFDDKKCINTTKNKAFYNVRTTTVVPKPIVVPVGGSNFVNIGRVNGSFI